jgi:Uma2 family endonuclease
VSTRAVAVTAEDLSRIPDDGLRRELIRGEVHTMTPGGAEHGRVAWAVAGLLFEHLHGTGAGVGFGAETGFVLARDPDTVRAPDAAFVSAERVEAIGRTARYWPGAPDFAAEVISPDDSFREVEEKALSWLAAGTRAVLVLDPARHTATVYRGSGEARVHTVGDTLDLSDAVPGWEVTVAELFSD